MRVVISGCSGGGKSTLLDKLGANGFQVFQEPGRQIVKEQLKVNGNALPWKDQMQFVQQCIARSIEFYCATDEDRFPAIYDRSYIDALSALECMESNNLSDYVGFTAKYRYHKNVYFTPPWEEIFSADEERRHSFADSVNEYERLIKSYTKEGYKIIEIPKLNPGARFELLKQSILMDWAANESE